MDYGCLQKITARVEEHKACAAKFEKLEGIITELKQESATFKRQIQQANNDADKYDKRNCKKKTR